MQNNAELIKGVKAGIPIAVGYIPIAIAFGLLAKSAGIPNIISMLMSFLVFAGASQFVSVNLISLGALSWEIVLTTFILNLRHFLMTASLSQRIKEGTSGKWMSLLAFGVTDETLPMLILKNIKLPPLLKSFFQFIPFAALAALIFPGVLSSTGNTGSAIAGTIAAIVLGLLRLNVMVVVLGSIAVVYLWGII